MKIVAIYCKASGQYMGVAANQTQAGIKRFCKYNFGWRDYRYIFSRKKLAKHYKEQWF